MNNFNNWTKAETAGYILEQLSREDISDEVLELIQGWIFSDDNSVEKEVLLQDILDRMFVEYSIPTSKTFELLEEAHRKLGFPAENKPALKPKKVPLYKRTAFKVAAVLLPLLVLAGTVFMVVNQTGSAGTVVAEHVVRIAPSGDVDNITLPDGSTVRLKGGGRLEYADNFTVDRKLNLDGEAYFSVVKQDGIPFIVETDKLTVTVLGTEFNLKAYSDDDGTVVAVTTGSVEVKDDSDNRVILKPMEQLSLDKATGTLDIAQFDRVLVDRWKSGRKVLDGVRLQDALLMAANFYGKEIVFTEELPGMYTVTTIMRETDSIEDVLEAMRFITGNFDYQMEGDTVIIKKR